MATQQRTQMKTKVKKKKKNSDRVRFEHEIFSIIFRSHSVECRQQFGRIGKQWKTSRHIEKSTIWICRGHSKWHELKALTILIFRMRSVAEMVLFAERWRCVGGRKPSCFGSNQTHAKALWCSDSFFQDYMAAFLNNCYGMFWPQTNREQNIFDIRVSHSRPIIKSLVYLLACCGCVSYAMRAHWKLLFKISCGLVRRKRTTNGKFPYENLGPAIGIEAGDDSVNHPMRMSNICLFLQGSTVVTVVVIMTKLIIDVSITEGDYF